MALFSEAATLNWHA